MEKAAALYTHRASAFSILRIFLSFDKVKFRKYTGFSYFQLLFTGGWSALRAAVICGAVWTGADSGVVLSVSGEQTCPNETGKTASVSDTLHTSADHSGPERRTHPSREQQLLSVILHAAVQAFRQDATSHTAAVSLPCLPEAPR